MTQDVVSLYNLALSKAGNNTPVASPTEISPEAEICNTHYLTVRDYIFGMANWTELKAFNRLALKQSRVSGVDWVNGDPEPGYAHSHLFPSDCVRPRHLSNFSRFTTGANASERYVYSNSLTPILTYTARRTDPSQWSNDLYMAVASALAAAVVTASSGKRLKAAELKQEADMVVRQMRAMTANGEQAQLQSVPDWIGARGFQNVTQTRYFYPLNHLLIGTAEPTT